MSFSYVDDCLAGANTPEKAYELPLFQLAYITHEWFSPLQVTLSPFTPAAPPTLS